MSDYLPTPRLSDHARQRCAEMGISTKVAKAIVRHWSVTRDVAAANEYGGGKRVIVTSDLHPDYDVVLVPEQNLIVTVGYRDADRYHRIA
jgi:hypothetical protein